MFGALEERSFRLVWLARTISSVGDAVGGIAFVFAVLEIGGSASDLGLVLGAGTLTRVLLLLVAGVWSDRLPRHLVMVGADLVRACSALLLAVLLLTGTPPLWQVLVLSVVTNAAGAFFSPASTGLVAQTVAPERLQQANALLGLSRSLTGIGGPAVGGVLVVTVGVAPVLLLDSLSFVASALLLARIRLPPLERLPTRFVSDLVEGWREMTSRTWYWLNLITHGLANVGTAAFWVLGPVIAATELGGAGAWGLASAGLGIGALAGGLLALRLRPRRPLVLANLALVVVALQPLALVSPLPLPGLVAACVLGGAGLTILNEVWVATMQRLIPQDKLARVSSYDWVISLVVAPAAYAGAGIASDAIGRGTTLAVAAACIAVPSLLILLSPGVRAAGAAPAT
jgi:MFS family permease